MKLNEYFAKGFIGQTNVITDGYDITEVRKGELAKCHICNSATQYHDVINELPICSTECAKAVVDEYWVKHVR